MFYGLDMHIMFVVTAGIAGIIVLLLLIYTVILNRKVQKLEEKYAYFMQDEAGKSMEAKLREDVDKLHNLQGTLDMIHTTQKDILAVQNH